MRRIDLLLATACVAFAAPAAASCRVEMTGVRFGAYDALSSSPLDTVAEVVVACPAGTPFSVEIDPGGNASGGWRGLRGDGAATLRYQLYRDPAFLHAWADGVAGTAVASGVGGEPVHVPVFARIPPRQNVPTGPYTDSVVVVVNL